MPDAPDVAAAPGALTVLTVLDLAEGVAAPYAARLLADYGARVIKVEPPHAAGTDRRSPYRPLDAGKLSLSLDYGTEAGAALLARLAQDVDAIIESAPTRRRADLGLDAEALIGRSPRIVIATVITPPDRPSSAAAGLHAFLASLAALWSAAQTEHGQQVEINEAFALASDRGPALSRYLQERHGAPPPPDERAVPPLRPHAVDADRPPSSPFVLHTTASHDASPPRLGEHTDAILAEIGLDAAVIDSLRRAGVV